jgi:hypothetical protein
MTIESLARSNMDLEELLDVEATIHYTNAHDLRRTLRVFFDNAFHQDSLRDHTIVVTGFAAENFIIDNDDDDDDDEPLILKKRKALYLEQSRILILTMPGAPHEKASRLFTMQLAFKLEEMNCIDEISPSGGAIQELNNVCKAPDESWGPVATRYITFALESGVSESTRALQCDAKIWLEHPESHVTQVVTVKISRTRPEIIFSVWKTTPEDRETRAQHPRRASLDHEVRVTLAHGRPIASGRLCLSFEQFFERRARLGTSERDLVFSTRELGRIARDVWVQMGFMPPPQH